MTPSNPHNARYTLTELADLAGVTPRTVRYYLAQGLLPAVGVAGPGAKYDDTHLARLRLIRRLQQEHQPLAEIRRRLESLDDAAIRTLVEAPAEPQTDSALDYIRRLTGGASMLHELPTPYVATPSAEPPYRELRTLRRSIEAPAMSVPPAAPSAPAAPASIERSQWERISLDPDVELHVRRPLPRSAHKRVERLVEIAHDLFKEDRP